MSHERDVYEYTAGPRQANAAPSEYDISQKAKADSGKSNPLLLEKDLSRALTVVNRVLDYGLEKYDRLSWNRVSPDRWDAACRRHRRDRDSGYHFDKESGLLHLAHEAAGLLIQIELFLRDHPQCDYYTFNIPPQDHKK